MLPRHFNVSNPILQFALGSPQWQQDCKKLVRLLRRSMDQSSPAATRQSFARDALREIQALQLTPAVRQELLLGWLREVTDIVQDPVLLHALGCCEVCDAQLTIAPYGWAPSDLFPPESKKAPYLRSTAANQAPTAAPTSALSAWQDAVTLATSAEVKGELDYWGEDECIAAIRSLVLMTVALDTSSLKSPSVRLAYFEGEALGLWRALSKRLNTIWRTDSTWMDEWQRQVLLHLRGKASAEQLLASDEQAQASTGSQPQHLSLTVISESIPPSNDRYDKETVKGWEALRQPLSLRPAPRRDGLAQLNAVLQQEFPWATSAAKRLADLLVPLAIGGGGLRMKPVLLVGPPGAGKSRFARRVAELLATPFMAVGCGGSSDAKLLSGTARGWASGEPSPILGHMLRTRCASPLVLLDELDKARSGSTAPPLESFLLGLLEPETSRRWRDGYLQAHCDLSHVLFWGTANSLAGMSRPLLSRFEIIYVAPPGPEHVPGLVAALQAELAKEWNLPAGFLPVLEGTELPSRSVSARELKAYLQHHYAAWLQREFAPERLH